MRYAVLLVPNFSLHALLRSDSSLAKQAVAVVAGEGRRAVIQEVSSAAGDLIVGLPVPLAAARCPGLLLRERDPVAEAECQRHLVAAAFQLSPRVESTGPGFCTVDLQGADESATLAAMRRLIDAGAGDGWPLRVGAGATPLLARYAAQQTDRILVVEDSGAFLAPLALDLAEPSAKLRLVLANWGLTTFGQLTAIPKADVGQRLGPEGVALWECARGGEARPLRLAEMAKTFIAEWRYEPPLETLEPLLFKLRRYGDRVAAELRAAGFVAQALKLDLQLEDESHYAREFRLPEPGCDVEVWLRALQTHLDTVRLEERVCGARLDASPSRPEHRQQGLFETGLTDPHAFWENLARLSALVGPDRVGTPSLVDSHAPDAYVLETPLPVIPPMSEPPVHALRTGVLRRFRPPVPVLVECEGKSPTALAGKISGVVRTCRGPVILRGDWWKPGGWACELWVVEMQSGGLYQLMRTAEGWSVDGMLE